MKTIYCFITVFFLILSFFKTSYSQSPPSAWPTFSLTAKNFTTAPGPGNQDSILYWDVYLLQTNYGQPGVDPFEFCCAQYNWYFDTRFFKNPDVGNLVLTNLGGQTELPPGLRPPTFQVDTVNYWGPNTGLLKTSGNLPNSSINFFISNQFPGTKVLRMKLTTNGHRWNQTFYGPDLRWRVGAPPNTFLAYFVPNPPGPDSAYPQYAQSLLDTITNLYVCEVFFYPVEMSGFISNVSGNNVELKWTTATETNNQKFEIERSVSNSIEWTKIGDVKGSGTTTKPTNYNFTDRKLNSGHYKYRLKQIDFNGTENYHELNDEVIVGVPSSYSLSQNYPNPFNPNTKIDYELPYDGKVSIVLYDISGREVVKLVNEVENAGYYSIQFNGANLTSGMYFYRINAEGSGQKYVNTKKMVLIK